MSSTQIPFMQDGHFRNVNDLITSLSIHLRKGILMNGTVNLEKRIGQEIDLINEKDLRDTYTSELGRLFRKEPVPFL